MTTSPTPPAGPLPAPREGSRRAEIALVAAEEFTRRGFHSTHVEHIAERLGVTPGALYRHVPGKYEMFRDAVALLLADLERAAGTGPGVAPTPAADHPAVGPGGVAELAEALTAATLTHRSRAALYRWQARYLTPADRAAVVAAEGRVHRRLVEAIRGRRRGGPADGAGAAAGAVLSCIASLGHHRIAITSRGAVELMTSIAGDLAETVPLPPMEPSEEADPHRRARGPMSAGPPPSRLRGGAATREAAVAAAIERFHSAGYEGVSMEMIGADVGVAASALYRHFPGKAALLMAAVDRTATLVQELLDAHAALPGSPTDPAGTLRHLLDEYVRIAVLHGPELMLYHSELGALGAADRAHLRRSQRDQLDRWSHLVLEAAGIPRPTDRQVDRARIRVHAALSVVLDGAQGAGFRPSAIRRLGELALVPLLAGGPLSR